jgi:hypothetical protein
MKAMVGSRSLDFTAAARPRCWAAVLVVLLLGIVPAAAPGQTYQPRIPDAAQAKARGGPQPIPAELLHSPILPRPSEPAPAPVIVSPAPIVAPPPPAESVDVVPGNAPGTTPEERYLLPLLLREQDLLKSFGKDHPEVQALRARIQVVRVWLATHPQPPRPEPVRAEAPPAPIVIVQPPPPPEWPTEPAKPAPPPTVTERIVEVRTVPSPAPPIEVHTVPVEVHTVPAPPIEVHTVAPPAPPPPAANGLLTQLITVLAALVVILLVQLVALVIVLRRFGARLTPQVRVELVQAPPAAGEVLTQRVYLEAPAPPARAPAAPMPDLPDLNAYRDELAAQADAEKEQDAAVFRQVFEDNLRLREQLSAAN